ncbi:uncharacterized protein LOC116117876 [Pistacia vera]|uniref:uncharacterized protein LOC116117876 n=1 Tax=Pistacia vera TaxID=55513 RepID=UPI0012635192|nr:uncharacterized protein LOC116117876 [Pistacia vera]
MEKDDETQTARKIKQLRTDNGGEYRSDPFLKVCQDEGIVRWAKSFGLKQLYMRVIHNRLPSTAMKARRRLRWSILSSGGVETTSVSPVGNETPMVEEFIGDEEKDYSKNLNKNHAVNRPRQEIRKPARFADTVAYALPIEDGEVPSTYNEVASSSKNGKWRKALKEEMQSLHKNETWEVVHTKNKKAIGCKWV